VSTPAISAEARKNDDQLFPDALRIVLGSDALRHTIATLQQRLAGFEAQTELAASTDYPPGQ
jgi:LPS O-antigen subunit length determinant protein (WzzB/FepE family)